jgi:type IV secretory pathway TraG/TraD family ATPase VirD4
MTPTKLLIGQILIVFAIVIAGVWAATQWAAAELGYQAQLGGNHPLRTAGGLACSACGRR